MYIKKLQDINKKAILSLFKVSTATIMDVKLAEHKKFFTKPQTLAQQELGDMKEFGFSMELDEPIGKPSQP